ncbi:N-terminal C2 in EEIG1 and EHBP1 proteins-domain-containing protein [Mycena olivaceomarginata]|nr:N-terminal C2 in EEIG1 and EHBP1 proteins-domain-containing protein [Mycena olivaceomarginata]
MSSQTDDDAPAPRPSTGGLRAHLRQLVPRHALFQVFIQIHTLASVPLVRGEFGVRWKWKNTHRAPKGKERAPDPAERDPDGDADSFGSTEEPLFTADTIERSGQTVFLPLRDHAVTWDHPLSAVVQMSVDRTTHRLLPHPLRLKVVQRVIPGDPDAPQNPRLGVVELDLAQYADSSDVAAAGTGASNLNLSVPSKGTVTRRYLLLESKTNATLRLSVRVAPLSTSTSAPSLTYIAPPLPQGEILATASASLLSTRDEVYRTRPGALDLYAPLPLPLSAPSSAASSSSSLPTPPNSQNPALKNLPTPSFSVHLLPHASGPAGTASLIDALFNPAPVREPAEVGPFTRLVASDLSSGSASASVISFPSRASSLLSDDHSASPPPPSFLALDPAAGATPAADRWWRPRTMSGPSRRGTSGSGNGERSGSRSRSRSGRSRSRSRGPGRIGGALVGVGVAVAVV